MNVFITGLVDHLRNHVNLSQPTTFTKAENLACLRNAVKCASGVSSPLTASQDKNTPQEQKIKELEGQGNLLMSIAAKNTKQCTNLPKPIQALEANMQSVTKR